MLSPEKLKLIRILKGKTQKEIGTALGVSKNYIGMMEGRIRPISDEMYDKWIKALNDVEDEVQAIKEVEEYIQNK